MITVNLIEDHKGIAESLASFLNNSGIVRVTAQYFDINSARNKLAYKPRPDVLLLDVALPDGSGIDFCKELNQHYPALKIIIYTNYTECNVCKIALKYKAKGFLLKSCDLQEILSAITTVYANKRYICEEMEGKYYANLTPTIVPTPREHEVLRYLSKGLINKQIAVKMSCGEENIHAFRNKLFIKFKCKNVAELIAKAYEMGFLP